MNPIFKYFTQNISNQARDPTDHPADPTLANESEHN